MAGVFVINLKGFLGVVAVVEHVRETETRGGGGGPVAEEWAHREVLDAVDGSQRVHGVDHRVDLGRFRVVFYLHEDDVFHHRALAR